MIDDAATTVITDRDQRTLLRALLVVWFVCVFPSCGGDSTQIEENLSSAEVQSLVQVLNTVHALDLDFAGPNPWPCPEGGTVSYTQEVSSNESGSLWQGSLGFADCAVASARGEHFVLRGNSSASVQYDFLGARTEGTATGEVTWRLKGRRGSCAIDLHGTWDRSGVRVTGSACGVQVDQAIDS